MRTIVIELPETVDVDQKEAVSLLAVKMYEEAKLTLGQAAEMIGSSKTDFMRLLSRYNVPFMNYDPGELTQDLNNARADHR